MKKLYLTFLWHMHQPYYKDDMTGVYHLPWVFLHGIKDYIEIPKYHEVFNVKAVFNLVPSLLEQIIDLSVDCRNDRLIGLISKPVLSLTDDEKNYLLRSLFWANETNMIKTSKRYYELFVKYGNSRSKQDISFSELIDLEVHFLIAWTGTFIKYGSSFVMGLIQRDRGYSEEDKQHLINILESNFRYIIDYYRSLMESGKIEISTTPFYHPILPLLIKPESFNEALPYTSIPKNALSMRDDAEWHVKGSKEIYKDLFGKFPDGVWPAEGSVSNDALNMFIDNGFKWVATDEDILSRSLNFDLKNRFNRNRLYKKFFFQNERGKINIFFRDKELSDLLGFVYSGMDAELAVNDFVARLREIYENCNFSPYVSIILDGENAWEFYKNNGRDFFTSFYKTISSLEWVDILTYSEAIGNENILEENLSTIASGSWIYGNFSTWMGHHEKNKAWEMLYDLRRVFDNRRDELTSKQIESFYRELHIAQGSDWFWWYGDDHYTEQADVIDYLFRKHIKNAYNILGVDSPDIVDLPIKKVTRKQHLIRPVSEVYSNFDGRLDSIFDYMGSGEVDIKFDMSAMHIDAIYLKKMRWGFSGNYLFMMLTGNLVSLKSSKENISLNIIDRTCNELIKIDLSGNRIIENGKCINLKEFKFEDGIELLFYLDSEDDIKPFEIAFELYKGRSLLDRAPVYSYLKIDMVKKDLSSWIV